MKRFFTLILTLSLLFSLCACQENFSKVDLKEPIAIGEDFGLFLEKVPGALALVGVGNEACGAVWPQHSPKYTVDEDALLNSVMLYAQVAMDHNAG